MKEIKMYEPRPPKPIIPLDIEATINLDLEILSKEYQSGFNRGVEHTLRLVRDILQEEVQQKLRDLRKMIG